MTTRLYIKDPPRTWTKKDWKEADRWLRIVSREVNKEAAKFYTDLLLYGRATWVYPK